MENNITPQNTEQDNLKVKTEFYHYLIIKSHNTNDEIYEELKEIYKAMAQENSVYLKDVYRIMCKTKGLLEYKASEFAQEAGISKNKVKAIINQLIEEGKIKRLVENETTFLLIK